MNIISLCKQRKFSTSDNLFVSFFFQINCTNRCLHRCFDRSAKIFYFKNCKTFKWNKIKNGEVFKILKFSALYIQGTYDGICM